MSYSSTILKVTPPTLHENLAMIGLDPHINILTFDLFTFTSLKMNHHWNKS